MKYILILYFCTFLNNEPKCYKEEIIPLEFNQYSDCIKEGYKFSYAALRQITDEELNQKKIAIKFQCKEVGVLS